MIYANTIIDADDMDNFANELYYKFDEWAREIYESEEYTDEEQDIISDLCSRCADMVEWYANSYGVSIDKDGYVGEE